MDISLIGDGWWRTACEAAGDRFHVLPPPVEPPANPYTADLNARAVIGPRWLEMMRQDRATNPRLRDAGFHG